jgi:polysaccharide export outer membrane protein
MPQSGTQQKLQSGPDQPGDPGELAPEGRSLTGESPIGSAPGETPAPELEGLTPEEILEGRDILRQREEAEEGGGEVTVIEEAEPDSLFNRYRTVGSYQDIDTDLRPFGYEFFSSSAVQVMTPRKDIPVSSDYVVGPGDEVKVLLWGRVNARYEFVVDRDGNIAIPRIGPLHVAGMSFEQMKGRLVKEAEQIVGANINVTMGELKSIQVFVLGDVRRPGSYALDSFSTVTTALLAAGGPTDIGSLRHIELKRDEKTEAVLDFYDFLLKGEKSGDMVLKSGDIVFVHTVGPLVGVAGNIKRPAIYELKDQLDLMSLFDLAGGIVPTAYTQQIQVERIKENEKQVVIDINDRDLSEAKDFMLQDADLVKVFPIVDRDLNAVYLRGNVKRPGKYELKPGMRVRDLIKDTSGLLKDTYFEYALIKRLRPPELGTELIPFNLGGLLLEGDASEDVELRPQDQVYVFSRWVFTDRPQVTVQGEVRKAGAFGLSDNMRIKDAVLAAGGLTREAYLKEAELYRTDRHTRRVTLRRFSLEKALAGDPDENIVLMDLDRVVVHSVLEHVYRKTVSVDGEVLNPGDYQHVEGMTVRDLVFASGNVLESAYLKEAEISSRAVRDGKVLYITHRRIDLGKALEGDPEHNSILKPYDRLFVKRLEDWGTERLVEIRGEVSFPGKYLIKKGERLSSLIQRAGGYTDEAYLSGAVFTRERVRELQQRQIEEMVDRLERELFGKGAIEAASALTPEEARIKEAERESKRQFIAKLKTLKATGRVSLRLEDPEAMAEGRFLGK